MSRLNKELTEKKLKDIESGYLICDTCNTKRELQYFSRQRFDNRWLYKTKKCKFCITGREVKVNKFTLTGKVNKHKPIKVKSNVRLSPEVKEFIKRVIYMKGYIDSVEAFKLVHYHINTFGPLERLIINIEEELTIMFIELLEVYKRGKKKNNIYTCG
jgi:hypothetical protein